MKIMRFKPQDPINTSKSCQNTFICQVEYSTQQTRIGTELTPSFDTSSWTLNIVEPDKNFTDRQKSLISLGTLEQKIPTKEQI